MFFLALFLLAPPVGCSKRSTRPKDCWDPLLMQDTCKIYPRVIDNNAAWSPGGKTIAYVHGGITQLGDTSGIYLIDTTGNNRRVLVPSVLAVQPAFSPDGQWIAFAYLGDDAIYKIKVNGDSLTRLTAGNTDQEPDWSPDGKWIAYTRASNPGAGLHKVSPDGTQDSFVFSVGIYPNWSADSKRLLMISGFLEQAAFQFYIGIFNTIDSTFAKILRLGQYAVNWEYLRWNPDNSKILLTVHEPSNDLFGGPIYLYTLDSTGQNLKRLLNTLSTEGAWSPDGKRIVYTDARSEYGTLFIMDADGRNKRQITLTGLPKKSPGRQA